MFIDAYNNPWFRINSTYYYGYSRNLISRKIEVAIYSRFTMFYSNIDGDDLYSFDTQIKFSEIRRSLCS